MPISAEQDTAGPMTRNVTDAAILLSVIHGADRNDPPSLDQIGHVPRDYTRFLDRRALRGARIGVWPTVTGQSPASASTDAVFQDFIQTLTDLGATPVDVSATLDPFFTNEFFNDEFTALLNEFKHDINAYLAATGGRHPADLAGLIQFDLDHADTEMPFFQQEIFDLSQTMFSGDPADTAAERTFATTTAQQAINTTMQMFHLDAIAAPTNSPAWVTTLGQGDAFVFGSSFAAAVSGFASIEVPMGFVGPLPVGVSFIGGRFQEPRLISIAFAFEQATHVRQPPQFLPTFMENAPTQAAPTLPGAARMPVRTW